MNDLKIAKEVVEDIKDVLADKYKNKYLNWINSKESRLMFTIEEIYDVLNDEMEAYEESYAEGEKTI